MRRAFSAPKAVSRTSGRWWWTQASTPRARRLTNLWYANNPPRRRSGGVSTTGPSPAKISARSWRDSRATCRDAMFSCRTAIAGADPEYSLPIRIITQKAWHSLFARTMFQKIRGEDALRHHLPEFTVIAAPGFQASPMVDGTRSETFIIINFRERLAIIGGTSYAGEIKKTIFTVLNFLLPLQGVLLDALLGERRCGRRCGNFLRTFGHRQDDSFSRPQAPVDWRRRAWLERQWRVQLRRWLLRQGDPPFSRSRAADLCLHAAVWHRAGKRDLR